LAGSSSKPILQTKAESRLRQAAAAAAAAAAAVSALVPLWEAAATANLPPRLAAAAAAVSAPDHAMARPWSIARRAACVSAVSCVEPTAPGVSVGSCYDELGSPAIQSAAASSASWSGMLTNRFTSDSFGVRFLFCDSESIWCTLHGGHPRACCGPPVRRCPPPRAVAWPAGPGRAAAERASRVGHAAAVLGGTAIG
jgi:hypothetical protein